MFDGFVLAGGKSSRMQQPKALLRLGAQTFAERAIAALAAIAPNKVRLVLNHDSRIGVERLPDLPQIFDVHKNRGALGGIHAALLHAESQWAAILACDYPFVTAALVRRLTNFAEQGDEKIAAVAPLQTDARAQPLCALYRVEPCLKMVERMFAENPNQSLPARALLENAESRLVEFAEYSDLPGAAQFFLNVNTPADFARAHRIFNA